MPMKWYRRSYFKVASAAMLLMCGCGDDQGSTGPPSKINGSENTLTSRWRLLSPPEGATVRIGSPVPWCYGAPKPRIADVRIKGRAKKVTLTVLLVDQSKDEGDSTCADLEAGVTKTVRLNEPLGTRQLYDGGASPPEKRWPRLAPQASNRSATSAADNGSMEVEVREVSWQVARKASASIQLGAFVPFCEGKKPKPQIARIEKKDRGGRTVLTLLVRFPKGVGKNCVGYGLGLTRWVKLGSDWRESSIFDGSTSPPSLRLRKQS
jgi:hypothetical protein